MKSFSVLLPLLFWGFANRIHPTFIDPTGTYILKGQVRNNRVITHSGEIRVKLLRPDLLVLCLYLNKGYPGYESGAMLDTMDYEENSATYFPLHDSLCKVRFVFTRDTVETIGIYSDPYASCGFPPGVWVAAVFTKMSSDVPVIQDLSGRGGIP